MLWLNGIFFAPETARIDPTDRGFTLGDGVFETIAMIDGAPRDLDRHLARLREGAGVLGFAVPYDDATIAAAVGTLAGAARLIDATVRITASHGPAPRGLMPPIEPQPTVLITMAPLPSPALPARAVIIRSTCRNENSPLSRIKSLNYLDNILARREAAERGGDEAILLNTKGRVAEASVANLFAVIGGIAVTPPICEGALPGIRRQRILGLGLAVESVLTLDDLARADEIFLTSSLAIRPVATLDGVLVCGGLSRPVTCAIEAALADNVR